MTFARLCPVRYAPLALTAALFSTALFAQDVSHAKLQAELEAIAKRAQPGTFGIAVVDLASGARWGVNADRSFPMMSDFKAPVSAAVLARIDAGTLTMTQRATIRRSEVVDGSATASVGERVKKGETSFTVDELMTAAVSKSDNTAVDALIRLLGGPEEVTRFLHDKGITETHIGSTEGTIAGIFDNLHGAAAPPAGETKEQEDRREREGYKNYITAPPNHTTPNAAALFLKKLWSHELLSPVSTNYLLDLMYAQTIPNRLRAGVPAGARFADKTGTSATVDEMTAAYNDTGLITWPDGHAVIVTAFLSGSTASKADRDALFAEIARDAARETSKK